MNEAEQNLGRSNKFRPQTAGPTIGSSMKSVKSHTPKKFKMLKELARLNQELRVQKPYSPSQQEKNKID